MIEEPAIRRSYGLLQLRLGDHLIQASGHNKLAAIQSAVALLRTLFEEHHVDPDHQSSLFFHGRTFADAKGVRDFTVLHRNGRVILTEFVGCWDGPRSISMPLHSYVEEVLRFAERVLARRPNLSAYPDLQREYVETYWTYLHQLTDLARRFLSSGCLDHASYCAEFAEIHGNLKRPLELQVLGVEEESRPFQPVTVLARILFGPLSVHERLPMRLNRGDVVLATVTQFTAAGVVMLLEGVGSGGVCRGDRLYGLQLFYP